MYPAHTKYGWPRAKSGASLPTVMMMVALMMTLAFTVLAISFNHLNLSFRNTNNAKAEHLAEAVLALAIERSMTDTNGVESYGVSGTAEDKTIRLTFDSLPTGSLGVLSFDESTALSLGVPYSTNNRSESATEGSNPNQTVPGQSLHLVARAEVGGAFSTMEAIIEIPKFPYSIASGGAIRSNGGLLVASVRQGTTYDLSLPLHEDDLQPGHLVTNSESGDDAIVLTGSNRVLGDVQSASGATVEKDTEVVGEMRLNADPVKLPVINAYDYDPRPEDNPQTVNSGAGTLSVKGYNKSESSLTVDNGIELKGGVLFVDGDLNVTAGGVRGKGAIIATGNINIQGDGEATSDNQAALIADGNITLRGTSTSKAKFAGLIYTKGNLNSENLRLAGVFVAAGDNSEVTLKDTELYQVDDYAKLELSGSPDFEFPNIEPQALTFNSKYPLTATYDFTALQGRLNDFKNPSTAEGEPEYLFKFKAGSKYMKFVNDANGPKMVETTGPDQYLLDGGDFGMKIFGQPVRSEAEAVSVVVAEIQARYAAEGKVLQPWEITTLQTLAKTLYASNPPKQTLSWESAVFTYENGTSTSTGTDPNGGFKWSIDLTEIVNASERMRIAYWARYR